MMFQLSLILDYRLRGKAGAMCFPLAIFSLLRIIPNSARHYDRNDVVLHYPHHADIVG